MKHSTADAENYGPPEMQEWARELIRQADGGPVYKANCAVVNDAEKRFPGRASLAMAVLTIQEGKVAGTPNAQAAPGQPIPKEMEPAEPPPADEKK